MRISLINQVKNFARLQLIDVEASHSWNHTLRVFYNAQKIQFAEGGNEFLILAGALLHDVIDEKLFDVDTAQQQLIDFLTQLNLPTALVDEILQLIERVSFGNEFDGKAKLTLEQKIVRDADRLDAIGAIGIARTFHFGGSKGREIFDASILPKTYLTKEAYRGSDSPTINHFYEKLLLLKQRMETFTGKQMAEERHAFMLKYLECFFAEIGFDYHSTSFDYKII